MYSYLLLFLLGFIIYYLLFKPKLIEGGRSFINNRCVKQQMDTYTGMTYLRNTC